MGEEEIDKLIKGCLCNDRISQKLLYKVFYGLSMGICLRYSPNRYEAAEIMNQGFYKVFKNLAKYDEAKPFKAWLSRIMINTAIDYYRANLKSAYNEGLDDVVNLSDDNWADKNLNYNQLISFVQQLPQSYRTIFNLYAIEGYTHEEIGQMLHISTGTSKSNLHKAREKLKKMITDMNTEPPICSDRQTIRMVPADTKDLRVVFVNTTNK